MVRATTHVHETTLIPITTSPTPTTKTLEITTSPEPPTTTLKIVDATIALDKVELGRLILKLHPYQHRKIILRMLICFCTKD